jgi:ubiquinone/menaquinone biosynthesis C-methylase UbiE
MKSSPTTKVDKFPPYHGLEWDTKINDPDHPNFWKYGVANLIFLDHVKGKKLVLDLGCGTGGSTFFLAKQGKAELIVGIDLVSDMVKVAKRNATTAGLDQKTCFLVCDGRHLPFKTSCFEALISRGDVFCFLVPLKSAVQELKRVMKPKGVMVLEMDNRLDWKPGTIISTGFQKTPDGKIAYVVEAFSTKRNHRTISYVLDPNGKTAKKAAKDLESLRKGQKTKCSLKEIREETVEIRQGLRTHWPTPKQLRVLFKKNGFTQVQTMGDGLLMKLLLESEDAIIEAMKKDPKLLFEIEKRIVPYIDPNKAPTTILRTIAPKKRQRTPHNS